MKIIQVYLFISITAVYQTRILSFIKAHDNSTASGQIIASTGLEDTLMANILIEQKAMKDYNDLIEKLHQANWADEELVKILQFNFVDEHLHTEWFRTKLIAMKQYEFSAKHFTPSTITGGKNNDVEAQITKKVVNRKPTPIRPRRSAIITL